MGLRRLTEATPLGCCSYSRKPRHRLSGGRENGGGSRPGEGRQRPTMARSFGLLLHCLGVHLQHCPELVQMLLTRLLPLACLLVI